jgi:uncharacterized protein YbjT (DUF2867 family)
MKVGKEKAMPNLILVTGATGNAGQSLLKMLLAKGYGVRAATRNINRIPSDSGVEAVPFEYSNPNTFSHALEGTTGVFLVAPPMDPKIPQKIGPFLQAAKDVGVPHLVMLSALGVEKDEESPLRALEHLVSDTSLPYTILRPNFFMENFTSNLAPMIREQNGIFLAAGSGKTSFVSTDDIAEVAAIAFSEGGSGKEYFLTGPEALDHDEVADLISRATGRLVTYQDISEELMLQVAREKGLPEPTVQYLGRLYEAVRAGFCAAVYDDIRRLTSHEARSFQDFAEANKDAWSVPENKPGGLSDC